MIEGKPAIFEAIDFLQNMQSLPFLEKDYHLEKIALDQSEYLGRTGNLSH